MRKKKYGANAFERLKEVSVMVALVSGLFGCAADQVAARVQTGEQCAAPPQNPFLATNPSNNGLIPN